MSWKWISSWNELSLSFSFFHSFYCNFLPLFPKHFVSSLLELITHSPHRFIHLLEKECQKWERIDYEDGMRSSLKAEKIEPCIKSNHRNFLPWDCISSYKELLPIKNEQVSFSVKFWWKILRCMLFISIPSRLCFELIQRNDGRWLKNGTYWRRSEKGGCEDDTVKSLEQVKFHFLDLPSFVSWCFFPCSQRQRVRSQKGNDCDSNSEEEEMERRGRSRIQMKSFFLMDSISMVRAVWLSRWEIHIHPALKSATLTDSSINSRTIQQKAFQQLKSPSHHIVTSFYTGHGGHGNEE